MATLDIKNIDPVEADLIGEDEGLLETAYLLRSPRNAERLLLALDQARRGEGLEMSTEELRREFVGGAETKPSK